MERGIGLQVSVSVEKLTQAMARLEQLGSDLSSYSTGCAEAREWGGPTIYPRHPVDEIRARVDANAIQAVIDVFREAMKQR